MDTCVNTPFLSKNLLTKAEFRGQFFGPSLLGTSSLKLLRYFLCLTRFVLAPQRLLQAPNDLQSATKVQKFSRSSNLSPPSQMEAFTGIIDKSLIPVLPPSVVERLTSFTPLEWEKLGDKAKKFQNEHVKRASLALLGTLRQFHGDVSTPAELVAVGILDSVVVSGFYEVLPPSVPLLTMFLDFPSPSSSGCRCIHVCLCCAQVGPIFLGR